MRIRNVDKEQLVKQTAIQMLVADGFEGFSVNKLARACNISVGTLYIYYKDKDDLITRIAIEQGEAMHEATLKNFDPEMHFAEGLKVQWQNRYNYMMTEPYAMLLFEQLRSSTYHEKVIGPMSMHFKEVMGRFVNNAVNRGEINQMPLEVYWSLAFAPLYSLIRFHKEGMSLAAKPFGMTDEILWQTFGLVVKALKIN
ncbi:TetR/AcrR family transcriptional regulator [Mucilaginibacter sp. HMF5004]|uniref:TetR/AcrR family transcriptional regulator n=1 Tax=Mucilaginibacter rivuli TaxID=2857527 RepID=UPI001C5E309B|nr:TetR/AcrR family transcriptional regulator [Mucilaginibacter rivuli]MBW4888703.1 TetR/AcrR family transcriptional regulator [Mucilaginibacter rivuli]